MPLYTKRISSIEIMAENLHNKEGEPAEVVEVGSQAVIRAGDKKVIVSISKDGKNLEITCTKALGYNQSDFFKLVL